MEFCVVRLRAEIEKDLTLKASALADSVQVILFCQSN